MREQDLTKAIQVADEVKNLLDHMAWTDIIKPKLVSLVAYYSNLLVKSTLGVKITVPSAAGPAEVSSAQLAGRVEGIQFTITLFEDILRRGERALKELQH